MDPLTAVALAGTARISGDLPAAGTALDPLIAAVGREGRERALLLAAGAAAVYRHAGTLPPALDAPEPSGPESLPMATPRAANLIASLISGAHADLLPEALGALGHAGYRLPPALLPGVLQRTDQAARATAIPVLGSRGRWLAGQNGAWNWALEGQVEAEGMPPDAEAIWQEGSPAQRIAVLRRVRDVDPPLARTWIVAAWKSEKVDTRHEMLACLEAHLSPDDEPLLETALGDRGEKVRERAAALLARIPESAFAARMLGRATLLDYKPAALLRTHGTLSATVPQTPDPAWRRDARQPALREDAAAYRETYIEETVALIPPAAWGTRLGASPAEILAAMDHAEGAVPLRSGFSRATLLHGDQRWAAALWDWWRDFGERKEPNRRMPLYEQMIVALLAVLPPEEAERLLASVLRFRPSRGQGAFLPGDPWTAAITALPYPWSSRFSRTCLEELDRFVQEVKPDAPMYYQAFWFSGLDTIAKRISPRSLGEAATLCASPPFRSALPEPGARRAWVAQQWAERLAEFAAIIGLRQQIQQTTGPAPALTS